MRRLTNKDENGFLIIPNIELIKQTRVLNEYTEKLSQKEDDDEQLGIDSHILFKALTDGIYVKDEKYYIDIKLYYSPYRQQWYLTYQNGYLRIDDYKIYWALTKEEL